MAKQDGATYAYTEYHFHCKRCERDSPGGYLGVGDETFGTGNGWPTRREARAALTEHLKTCKGENR